jgi:hypothetical protein
MKDVSQTKRKDYRQTGKAEVLYSETNRPKGRQALIKHAGRHEEPKEKQAIGRQPDGQINKVDSRQTDT